MRTTILVLSLIALPAPSQAAQAKPKVQKAAASREQMCRALVGKNAAYHQGQRSRDCLMGKLPVLTHPR
jgi:hypothetical protein